MSETLVALLCGVYIINVDHQIKIFIH